MPTAPVPGCASPGCPRRATYRGRCDKHAPPAWAGSAPRSSRPWERTRTTVLRRDRNVCYLCGGRADQVDHVIPRAEGGSDDPANLAAICDPCHRAKSQAEAKRGQYGR